MVRYVTGHVHVGRAGPAELVGQDPVLSRDFDGREVGFYADARHGEIASDTATPLRHDRFQAFGPFEAGDLVPGQQIDALRAVDGADQRADLAAQDLPQGNLAWEDRRHWTPSSVSDAATSQPMNPMPTTTARRPGTASRLIASHSAIVRR